MKCATCGNNYPKEEGLSITMKNGGSKDKIFFHRPACFAQWAIFSGVKAAAMDRKGLEETDSPIRLEQIGDELALRFDAGGDDSYVADSEGNIEIPSANAGYL